MNPVMLWLQSLLNPDVTLDGRLKPEPPVLRTPQPNPFLEWTLANVEREHQRRRDRYERQRVEIERMKQLQDKLKAAALHAYDRPPVRQGRDL